jgi:signal transduction histidine kinase
MKTQDKGAQLRLILAMLIPFVALALQLLFWPAIQPYVWFLFYPAVFFSSWIGGLSGGLMATVISAGLVWWFFIAQQTSLAAGGLKILISVAVFLGMGLLFSLSHGRLRKANQQAAEALEAARTANDRLRDANEKITGLYEKTKELDKLKTQFFANISHELRTPLALILGPVARRLAAADSLGEERRDLEVVDRNARLLYRHVSDLLDVAKIEAGRLAMQYSQVDFASLTRFVASHFEVLAVEKRISLVVQAPPTLPAQVDGEKCQRILLNLLSNALSSPPMAGPWPCPWGRKAAGCSSRSGITAPGCRRTSARPSSSAFARWRAGPNAATGAPAWGWPLSRNSWNCMAGPWALTRPLAAGPFSALGCRSRRPRGP